ncbi:hypothetical protein CFC21_044553 [Triticum aestivum]|uniref:Uncharacterized protein n=2 Tax=Triticum aestivum TaxID=4565 RepID=A0A9R1FR34_WHEAT|nr:hypothetical protein CFC21_044553 [Triticum aestivum]
MNGHVHVRPMMERSDVGGSGSGGLGGDGGGEAELSEVEIGVFGVFLNIPRAMRQHPPPILGPDHALVQLLAPPVGHHVLIHEEVGGLVDERRIPAPELELLAAALVAVEKVEVRLEVVVAREVEDVLEERRQLVVERQLHADVGVDAGQAERAGHAQQRHGEDGLGEDAGHLGHRVVHVEDAQRLHAQLPLEALPEHGVPDARAGVGEDADGRLGAGGGHVDACLGDVVGAEHGQRGAEAVAGDRHAHLLALRGVPLHQLPHLGEHLLPRRVLAVLAVRVLASVELGEPFLNLDARIRARQPELADRFEERGYVGDPLELCDGAPPGDGDVPAADAGRLLVGGHGDEADEGAGLAPHPVVAGVVLLDAEAGEAGVGGGVEVAGDLVANAGEADVLEEGLLGVLAGAGVAGVAVVVEGVVAGLRELAVPDELPAERPVDGVQQAVPVVAAVHLPPPRRQLAVGAAGLLRQGAALHVSHEGFCLLLLHGLHLVGRHRRRDMRQAGAGVER